MPLTFYFWFSTAATVTTVRCSQQNYDQDYKSICRGAIAVCLYLRKIVMEALSRSDAIFAANWRIHYLVGSDQRFLMRSTLLVKNQEEDIAK